MLWLQRAISPSRQPSLNGVCPRAAPVDDSEGSSYELQSYRGPLWNTRRSRCSGEQAPLSLFIRPSLESYLPERAMHTGLGLR